jgi:uncharacterized integral membrane protein (TIGR00698 family)
MVVQFEDRMRQLSPGVLLAIAIAVGAWLLGPIQQLVSDSELIEPLVLALLLGIVVRAFYAPDAIGPGVSIAAKSLLEAAIVLLGLTLDLNSVADAGTKLAGAVMITVTTAIVLGIVFGRIAGLSTKQSILIAVGNAICGNSAIAAVAPVIRAKRHEVASAIAFTAVLGIGVVLGLPALIPLIGLSHYEFGVIAGLTVYAVPQVLATTLPVSVESGQIATLVKLTRVLLLGPVVAIFAFLHRHEESESTGFSLSRFLPWFLIGFAVCAAARTSGIVPTDVVNDSRSASKLMTIVAMAALGLGVDIRVIRGTGGKVALVVSVLMVTLVAVSIAIVHVFGLDQS